MKLEGCTKDIFGSYKIVDINNYTKEELIKEKEFLQRVMKYIIRSKISQRQYKEIMEKIKIEKEEEIMFVKLISDLIDEMLEK